MIRTISKKVNAARSMNGKAGKYSLNKKCSILFSPTFGKIDPSLIVEWILEGDIPVRMQLQMHKHIWESEEKGV